MNEPMKRWGLTPANIIQIVILLGGLIWAAAFLRSDVTVNAQTNIRQDLEHARKDVIEVQLKAIRNQLDRIEEKTK